MIQAGSVLKVCDRTGVSLVQCIKVFGSFKKRIAFLGDVILVSVKKFNTSKSQFNKAKRRRRFSKGSLQRALIVRTKIRYQRFVGVYVRFDENAAILVNKSVVPVSNRVFGPVLRELCIKRPALGSISRFVI